MNQSFRRAAVGIPGFCAFFNLYGPQSLLPSLAREFDATPAQISLTVTATTLAIAISAPFAGRLASGLLADLVGWRAGFLMTAAMTFACGIAVAAILPRERNFTRSEGLLVSARQMLSHLRTPQLLATYAVGFGTLFTFVAL